MSDLIIKLCHENLGHMGQESVSVFERDILDSERKMSSTTCNRKMHELSTSKKGMPRGGTFTRR